MVFHLKHKSSQIISSDIESNHATVPTESVLSEGSVDPIENSTTRNVPTVHGQEETEEWARYKNYPLVQSMIRHESVRKAALEEEGTMQMNYPLSNEGWIYSIFIIRGRALDWMVLPWSVAVLHAALYTILQELVFGFRPRNMQSWEVFFSFVLNSTLAFLLVFRLNRAAGRYWDAREMWGTLVANARSFVCGIIVHSDHDPQNRDHAIRWLLAFTIATMELLRGETKYPRGCLAGILSEDEVLQLSSNKHPPLYAANMVRRHLKKIFHVDADTPVSIAQAHSKCIDSLEIQLNFMMEANGGMERIRSTPLPMVYVAHLRTFLMLSLILFPYVWGPSWRWSTIPIIAVTAFAWLGIDSAAAEVECPFRRDRVNALNMDAYCLGVLTTTLQQIKTNADMDIVLAKHK